MPNNVLQINASEPTQLLINNQPFKHIKSLSVQRSIWSLAGTLTLQTSGQAIVQIPSNAPYLLEHEGHEVIAGHTEGQQIDYSPNTHNGISTHRDYAADLIDSSAQHSSGEWRGNNAADIIRSISPYPVEFTADGNGLADLLKPLPYFAIEPEETINDAIQRIITLIGAVAYMQTNGSLMITRTGTRRAPAALVLGGNVKAAESNRQDNARYHKIIVHSQAQDTQWSGVSGGQAQPYAEAIDPAIRNTRTLVIQLENANQQQCQQRANHERAVRAARAHSVSYTVQGWQAEGQLWDINQLAPVQDTRLGIDKQLLIASVQNTLGEDGSHSSQLELIAPEALQAWPEDIDPIDQPQRWSGALNNV